MNHSASKKCAISGSVYTVITNMKVEEYINGKTMKKFEGTYFTFTKTSMSNYRSCQNVDPRREKLPYKSLSVWSAVAILHRMVIMHLFQGVFKPVWAWGCWSQLLSCWTPKKPGSQLYYKKTPCNKTCCPTTVLDTFAIWITHQLIE